MQVTVNWTAVIVTDPQTKTHRLYVLLFGPAVRLKAHCLVFEFRYLDMLQPVARDFRGKFIFVNMDGNSPLLFVFQMADDES